jgi:uncharacterized protein (TIGR02145 family)
MKKFLFAITVIIFSTYTVLGQAPESFKYQTVVRNSDGEILVNQPITLIIDILQGSISGSSVCNETFYETTNDFGLVNLEIGSNNTEAFQAIDWASGPFFIKVTLNGTIMGTIELLSVPYSLFAKRSGEYLPPQMPYAEIYGIPDPINGMLVYCTDCDSDGSGELLTYENGDWFILSSNCLGPMQPEEGNHDSTQTQITWNWNVVPGALGYKWNTIESYSTAIDLETNTSKIETGLICNSLYTRYVWSYSTSCHSEPTMLTQSTAACGLVPCPDPPIVVYEGRTYNTVQIGLQCWLKENLDIGTQIDGSADPEDNEIIEKYCFDDLAANCELYGGLYQFHEMMAYNNEPGSQGICPEGWHVPTDAEWCVVSSYVDSTVDCYTYYFSGEDAGLKMKATSGWIENGNGNNESGFTALPGGVRYISYYDGIGWASDIWTSTSTYGAAYYRVFGSNQTGIGRYPSDFNSHHGFAVRCLKDE